MPADHLDPKELAKAATMAGQAIDAAEKLPHIRQARLDAYATAALTGILAGSNVQPKLLFPTGFALAAYELADAMLEERTRRLGPPVQKSDA